MWYVKFFLFGVNFKTESKTTSLFSRHVDSSGESCGDEVSPGGRACRVQPRGTDRVRTARLFREPSNTHDPNAKKVVLNGHHVGFLPKGFGPIDMGFCELIELRKWTPKRKRADDPQPEPQICVKVRVRVLSIPDPATGLGLGRAAANMGHVI